MSCCTRIQFAKDKAKNFRTFLEPFAKESPEIKSYLEKYTEDNVEELTKQYLAPLYVSNTLGIARDQICDQLKITDQASKDKVLKYLTCFCECIL
jgi:hypothetical protein